LDFVGSQKYLYAKYIHIMSRNDPIAPVGIVYMNMSSFSIFNIF
jgi:hypothetical protein